MVGLIFLIRPQELKKVPINTRHLDQRPNELQFTALVISIPSVQTKIYTYIHCMAISRKDVDINLLNTAKEWYVKGKSLCILHMIHWGDRTRFMFVYPFPSEGPCQPPNSLLEYPLQLVSSHPHKPNQTSPGQKVEQADSTQILEVKQQ